MILTGNEIHKNVLSKKIIIDPFDKKNINPNSYNFSLGSTIKVYKDYVLDQCEGKGHLPPLLLKLETLLSFSRTQVGNRLVIILNIFLMIDDSHDLSKAGLMRHLRLFSSSN